MVGGAEVYVRNIAEEFLSRGHQVVVISTSSGRMSYTERINGVKVYRVNSLNFYPAYKSTQQPLILKPMWHINSIWNPHSYSIVKKILEKENPDVVHIHTFRGLSLSVFSAAKSLKKPFVFTAHDYSLLCPKTNLLRSSNKICRNPHIFCKNYMKVQRFIVNRSPPNIFTAPSWFVINKYRENKFFENVKAIRLPLGINFGNSNVSKNYDVVDILFVGNLSMHKGVHILIQAFRKLQYENIRLHIVGKGKDIEKFKRLAGNDPRIRFCGFVSENELRKLYEIANIVVVPSIWYEVFGMIIIECFKSGTPVIGSRIGGIPELVKNGYNGLLFEAGHVTQLNEVLSKLIIGDYSLRTLECGARKSIEKYNMSRHISHLLEIYNKLGGCKNAFEI